MPESREERKFRRQRAQLVDELRERGISDENVLSAIGSVPRHEFVEDAMRPRAYADEALPIGLNQTISQPFTVAYQTSLLEIRKGDRILEIGTGSGYQAAVLCEMGARVFSIERHEPLLQRTRALLARLGYRVTSKLGDGTQGWPAFAPFDGIVVTAGAVSIPPALVQQLRAEDASHRAGRLVIPVGGRDGQTMNLIRKTGPGPSDIERQEFHSFRFVPLIGDEG